MEKNGYTVKHQAQLLRNKLEQLETEVKLKISQTNSILLKLENDYVDWGGLMYPSASDMLSLAQSVGLTNARLEALVWVEYNAQEELAKVPDVTHKD